MKRTNQEKREPSRGKEANEIWVTYGETRSTGTEFEFDRLDMGFARSLRPGEDREQAMIEEARGLEVLVRNYMAGEYY